MIAAIGASASAGAAPQRPPADDLLRTYVAARAAEVGGDERRAARLFAELSAADPGNRTVAYRALERAIIAGDTGLALSLAGGVPGKDLSLDARLLLVVDDLRGGRIDAAVARLQASGSGPDLAFLVPLVRAWQLALARDNRAPEVLGQVDASGPIGPFMPEQRALMLARLRRTAEAEPLARRALATAGGREQPIRLRLAEAFRGAGDRTLASSMLEAPGRSLALGRERLRRGRPIATAIDTPAAALGEVLVGLAIGLNREEAGELPIALAQVARFAAPGNSEAILVLGLLLDQANRPDDALAAFQTVAPNDVLASQALDARVRTLLAAERNEEALNVARAAAADCKADAGDLSRLGDVYDALDRHAEAADAYLRAMNASATGEPASADGWMASLLAATSLEQAGRWPEARDIVSRALIANPNQPLLLNFLGYAKLTHAEDIEAAEAMLRKASSLRPGDASITDSLGWALYKRGKLDEAIATLRKAAAGDSTQSEIDEHLGDALYVAGRRFEARFAWQAALVTAEEARLKRLSAKIDRGLEPATAAP